VRNAAVFWLPSPRSGVPLKGKLMESVHKNIRLELRKGSSMPVKNGLKNIAALTVCSLILQAAVPPGWYLAGSRPADYECDVDVQALYNGLPSAYLKAKKPVVDGFGTLMQDFRTGQYAGQRVRFSAFVKSESIQNWAGLWMRVDKVNGTDRKTVEFDNMQNRPIKGSTTWQRYEVVLDVPKEATGIFFGILLAGSGTVWLNGANFEIVGPNIPTTDKRPEQPANLGFEK
jgi:hypothetical protein